MIRIAPKSAASDSGTTATSPPFSPFSPATSVASDNTGTSDEPADLGAFTSVFRALSQLQIAHPRTTTSLATIPAVEEDDDDTDRFHSDSDSSDVVTPNRARDSDSDHGVYAYDVESAVEAEDSRPVWNHEPIASYLVSAATPAPAQQMARQGTGTYVDAPTLSMAHEALLSQTLAQTFVPEPYQHVPRTPGPGDPTLGALEQALGFLAAERTRVASQLDSSIEAEYAYRTEGKRRRRKRKKGVRDEDPPNPLLNHSTSSLHLAKHTRGSNSGSAHERTDTAVPSPSEGTSFSSSSADPKVRRAYMEHPPPMPRVNPNMLAHEIIASYSVPTPPPGPRNSRRGRSFDARSVVNHHERPIAHERASYDPRIQRLSSGSGSSPTGMVQTGESKVARLRLLANNLARRFPQDAGALRRAAEGGGGGAVERQQSLLYVFVDHSNILVGFLEYIKKHPHLLPPSTGSRRIKPKILHTALVLLLERGRPCARRILVASSPLHQTLDGVVGMGYEVSVLQRVEIKEGDEGRDGPARPEGFPRRELTSEGLSRREIPSNDGFPRRDLANGALPGREIGSSEDDRRRHRRTPSDAPRTRYREEAVDELLQLKLLQTILDTPPATIVLATGDGASSQFNPDGFVGCVRRAIERGWNVELVAWEEGVSRAWRELEREGGGRFRVVGLEGWVGELVDF